tara:strand:+ start:574 stop:747 length:174 start_codon:yes stop_codon:yes gene_type:complete
MFNDLILIQKMRSEAIKEIAEIAKEKRKKKNIQLIKEIQLKIIKNNIFCSYPLTTSI